MLRIQGMTASPAGTYELPPRFQLASGTRIEAACAFMGAHCAVARIQSLTDSETCSFRLKRAALGSMNLDSVYFGIPVRVEIAGRHSLAISWTNNGHGHVITGGRNLRISTECGSVVQDGDPCLIETSANATRVELGIPSDVLKRQIAALTGIMPDDPIRLNPEFSTTGGVGATLRRLVAFVMSELDSPDAILLSPGAAAGLQDAIAAILLQNPRHSHFPHFETRVQPELPMVVRRVEEFLEAHAREAVSMSDLPSVAGVGLRAVEAAFHKYRGYSPREFLMSVRLRVAHLQLKSGRHARVIDVAFDCGFAKLSRFSAAYHKQFGELPSATLRRVGSERS
jgi:AraC-like DNA-binding protein